MTNFDESETFDNRLSTALPFHANSAHGSTFDLPPGATVAVVSDGIGDAFSDVENAQTWFAGRWQEPPPLASFILDVGYEARGCGDDRTAVVVWCGHAARDGN